MKQLFIKLSLLSAAIVQFLIRPIVALAEDNDFLNTQTPLTDPNVAYSKIGDLISIIMTIVIFAAALTCFILIAVAALQWISARSGDGAAKARTTMKYAIMGLIIVSLTYVAMTYFNVILPSAN